VSSESQRRHGAARHFHVASKDMDWVSESLKLVSHHCTRPLNQDTLTQESHMPARLFLKLEGSLLLNLKLFQNLKKTENVVYLTIGSCRQLGKGWWHGLNPNVPLKFEWSKIHCSGFGMDSESTTSRQSSMTLAQDLSCKILNDLWTLQMLPCMSLIADWRILKLICHASVAKGH
jgi:hypothetical protein